MIGLRGSSAEEYIAYCDGATSGANAGEISCGQTPTMDVTRTLDHAYASAGTYEFTDEVSVPGLPPACRTITLAGHASVAIGVP